MWFELRVQKNNIVNKFLMHFEYAIMCWNNIQSNNNNIQCLIRLMKCFKIKYLEVYC